MIYCTKIMILIYIYSCYRIVPVTNIIVSLKFTLLWFSINIILNHADFSNDRSTDWIYTFDRFYKLITVLLNFIKKIAIEIEKIKLFDFFAFQIILRKLFVQIFISLKNFNNHVSRLKRIISNHRQYII